MPRTLEYPETKDYTPAHIVSKTTKLDNGRFGAIGALYFMGQRGMYVGATGNTRHAAERAVMAILDPNPYAAEQSERRLRAMERGGY
jgi:hypothetical protein